MKKSIIFFCVLLITFSAEAQDYSLPANKYKAVNTNWTIKNLFIEVAFNQSSFLNQTYGQNELDNNIKSAIGYGAMLRYMYKSFFVEGGIFFSRFDADGMKKNLGLPEEYSFIYRGIEGSINAIIFPNKSKIGFLKPYLGAGYLNAESAITTKESYSIGKDIYSSYKVDGVFGQIGLMIFPVKNFSMNITYKRTINSFEENKGNARLQLGFAYALNFKNILDNN
jgi:hypothetical protein